jgi:serine/threonine protein kinase
MSEVSAATTNTSSSGAQMAPGTRIGKYEIVHRIACGGMAEIYLARVSGIYGFEKYVVLKRILPQYAANDEFVHMFLKEARVAASLDHTNIAHVYDIGEVGRDTFFTMEYLHGEDLRYIIRDLERRGLRLPLEHALEIVIGAAAGLHFAHDKRGPDGRSLGIVHRDVSPANIVVTYDGGVKVVDFGIAKLAADPELSQRYALKGKLAYMSPEQLHNAPVDRRSDLFALGIVLYEITTQVRLFKGATEVQTMKAVMEGVVPLPSTHVPGYPAALERIVLRALARSPEDRYQSARELQLELEAFVHDERIRLSPAALAEWMEKTFGPKQEIWHTLPAPQPAEPSVRKEPTVKTKVVSRADVAAMPNAAAVGFSVPIDLTTTGQPRRRSWAVPAMLAVIALVATGGAMWQTRGRSGVDGRPAVRPVVVVAEQGHVAVEQGAASPPPPSAPVPGPAPALASAPPVPATRVAPVPASRAKRAADPAGATRGSGYSATFARRETDIRRCFLEHPSGASSTEISLRFEVGQDGHVASVAVLPPAVGAAPLGACLAAVGKSTVFAKQAAPLTFRIPLTVQVDTAGKTGP